MTSSTISISALPRLVVVRSLLRLSFAEQVALIFCAYLSILAVVFNLGARDCLLITLVNSAGTSAMMLIRRHSRCAPWIAVARDLFPALFILLAYRESGLLVQPDRTFRLDHMFAALDSVLLRNRWAEALLAAGSPWVQHYLELVYLLCYPLVPLGAMAVYFASRRRGRKQISRRLAPSALDEFWSAVLLATLFCYATYPLFPLTPPRVLFNDVPGPHIEPLLRRWNFWLLDHYSVQACIFPSGHVAAVTAVALAVRKYSPRFGALFIFLATSVAIATVYGRYHYAADAIAGALVGIGAYALSRVAVH